MGVREATQASSFRHWGLGGAMLHAGELRTLVSWEQGHFLPVCLPGLGKLTQPWLSAYCMPGVADGREKGRGGLALGEEGRGNQGANYSLRGLRLSFA